MRLVELLNNLNQFIRKNFMQIHNYFWPIATTIIGLICILVGIYNYIEMKDFSKRAVETTGVVMHVEKFTDYDEETSSEETYYKVKLVYEVNKHTYNSTYFTHSNKIRVGERKTIYYDKNNPNVIKENLSLTESIINFAIGVITFVTGLLTILYRLRKENEKKRLIEYGDKIYADLKEVISKSYHSNIVCIGEDYMTGKIRTFKSENIPLMSSVLDKMKRRNIKTFPVYIDENNRKKYYLSLEELDN